MPSLLRLGHPLSSLHPSLTNGPGWRVSIWTQGCSLLCTSECLNPHFLSPRGGWLIPVTEIAGRIRQISERDSQVEGITVLGGEPFDQAGALAELLQQLRALGLSAMVYTGHVYEHLRASGDEDVKGLLGAIDLLVDGPFLPDQYSGTVAWRGSLNQRLLCLTARYTSEELEQKSAFQKKAFSIRVSPSGLVSVGGIQERKGAMAMRDLVLPRANRPKKVQETCSAGLKRLKLHTAMVDKRIDLRTTMPSHSILSNTARVQQENTRPSARLLSAEEFTDPENPSTYTIARDISRIIATTDNTSYLIHVRALQSALKAASTGQPAAGFAVSEITCA